MEGYTLLLEQLTIAHEDGRIRWHDNEGWIEAEAEAGMLTVGSCDVVMAKAAKALFAAHLALAAAKARGPIPVVRRGYDPRKERPHGGE